MSRRPVSLGERWGVPCLLALVGLLVVSGAGPGDLSTHAASPARTTAATLADAQAASSAHVRSSASVPAPTAGLPPVPTIPGLSGPVQSARDADLQALGLLSSKARHEAATSPSSAPPFSVESTLDLETGVVTSGNVLPPNCLFPMGSLYVPSANEVLVSCLASGTGSDFVSSGEVLALNPTNGAVEATLLTPLGPGPMVLAATADGVRVVVGDSSSSNVTILDPATNTVVGNVSVMGEPVSLAADNATGVVFAALSYGDAVLELDAATGAAVDSFATNGTPVSVAFDPANSEAYAAVSTLNAVVVINATQQAETGFIPVGSDPVFLTLGSVPGQPAHLLVADEDSSQVSVIDTASNAVLSSVSVVGPEQIAFVPGTGTAVVASAASGSIVTITAAGKVGARVTLSTAGEYAFPFGVVADPTSGYVFVDALTEPTTGFQGVYGGALYPFDPTTDSVLAPIPIGSDLFSLVEGLFPPTAIVPSSDVLFAVSSDAGSVTLIDAATPAAGPTVRLGVVPVHVAADPATGDLYVLDEVPGEIDVVDGATGALVRTIPVPGLFDDFLAINPAYPALLVGVSLESDYLAEIGPTNGSYFGLVPAVVGPVDSLYDAANDQLYVYGAFAVYALNAATDSEVTRWTDGGGGTDDAIALDPASGHLFYVSGSGVGVELAANDTPLANLTLAASPSALTYDSATGDLYVSEAGSNQVAVVNGSTDALLTEVDVGAAPVYLNVDPVTDRVYVADTGADEVSVIDAADHDVVGTVGLPSEPSAVGTDPGTGDVLVGEIELSQLAVISGTTLVENLSVGLGPAGAAYDPVTGGLAVVNEGSGTLSLLAPSTQVHNVTFTETGLAPGTEWQVSVAATGSPWNASDGPSTSFWLPDGSYRYAVGAPNYFAKPASGTVVVDGDPVSISVNFTQRLDYDVNFTASGLAAGAPWSVDVNGVVRTVTADRLTLSEPLGFYYDSFRAAGYLSVTANGTFAVTGAPLASVNVTFEAVYELKFVESGLPTGTTWDVELNDFTQYNLSASRVVGFAVTSGYYGYQIGTSAPWLPTPASGVATVDGASVTVTVTFGYGFPVTFTESGLPAGTEWMVNLSGQYINSFDTTVDFTETNGTYAFEIPSVDDSTPSPASGSVAVSDAPYTVSVVFPPPPGEYTLTFDESPTAHLPAGTFWEVALSDHGITETGASSGSSISFTEPNGTYSYNVTPLTDDWLASPRFAVVQVDGSAVTQTIGFDREYVVEFDETGLVVGSPWTVFADGRSYVDYTTVNAVLLTNGTFTFAVNASAAYRATPATGSVTVAGGAPPVSVVFSYAPGYYPVEFAETGLAGGLYWGATIDDVYAATNSSLSELPEANGTYTYTLTAPVGYQTIPSSGSVHVAGGAVIVPVPFGDAPGYFTVTFSESGLASGLTWGVAVSDNTTYLGVAPATIAVPLADGTYSYYPTAKAAGYSARPGLVAVDGTAISQAVSFVYTAYSVTVTESGLPTGTTWYLNLTRGGSFESDHASVSFSEPNGSYAFTLGSLNKSYAAPAGGFSVAGGDVSRSVAFAEVVYAVTLEESGLPHGTRWYVNLTTGPTLSSTTDTITTDLPNGSYAYNASLARAHWVPDPAEGTFTVSGASPATLAIAYVYAYAVTFDRPTGSSGGWGVTVSGPGVLALVVAPADSAGFGGAGATLDFYEPNGTYAYVALVSSDSGYDGTGSFVVKGAAVTVVPPGLPAGHLPPYELYGVVVGAVVVVGAIAAVLVFRRRPRGPSPTVPPDGITGGPTPSPTPPPTDGAPGPEAPGGP